MIVRKKKKTDKEQLQLAEGIYLKTPYIDNGNIVYGCFLRSLIAFFLVSGSIGGFLSALEVTYHHGIVIVAYLILSLYFSFLYALPKLVYRDVGYILFFGVFVAAIYRLRMYANAGLYVVVNAVLQRAKTFFELSGVREYDVKVDNDNLTVAIVSVFIGMVLIIILNIWLYSKMSFFWTVLLTFPVLLIPIYMKLTPDTIYIYMLLLGYMMVLVFKANGHYLAFAKDKPFHIKNGKHKKLLYTQDAGVFQHTLMKVAVFFGCICVGVSILVNPTAFDKSFQKDTLRQKTSDTIGNFLLLGFAGLYNQYPATGGISGGKLGGISNVRPDYMTDLLVTYTPYSSQAVYLKAFTGGQYGENQWMSLYEENAEKGEDRDTFEDESMRQEMEELKNKKDAYYAKATMKIQNVGADGAYLYYPYYTCFEDYSIYNNHAMFSSSQGIGTESLTTYTFYPKLVWEEELGNEIPGEIDHSGLNPVFLEVPEKNQEVIENECKKIGLTATMTVNEIADRVACYFEDTIPYTLNPGATPKDEDFINYFLTKNRKGYCAHFASAATLIFRAMGIPARYVEGYAFSLETVLASDMNEWEDVKDFYTGYSAIGDSPVMDVEVSDAMAHAWVEIYVEDFGWKVVEVTPGGNLETDEDNFWDAFTNAMNNLDPEGGNTSDLLGNLDFSQMMWLVYVVIVCAGVYGLCRVLYMCYRKINRFYMRHQRDERLALIARYAQLCDMLRLCDVTFDSRKSHREQLEYMQSHYGEPEDISFVCSVMEQISYSNHAVDPEAIRKIAKELSQVTRHVKKQAGLRQRIRLCKR